MMNDNASYQARFMFDPGSGTCLWSTDDRTRAKYGYPIDHSRLYLSPELASELDQLIARFDRSIDWSDPGGPGAWNASDELSFREDAATVLERLRQELAPEWSIAFESAAF